MCARWPGEGPGPLECQRYDLDVLGKEGLAKPTGMLKEACALAVAVGHVLAHKALRSQAPESTAPIRWTYGQALATLHRGTVSLTPRWPNR